MSLPALRLAFDAQIDDVSRKAVYITLGNAAWECGHVWLSYRTIGRRVRTVEHPLDRAQVIKHVRRLVTDGLLEKGSRTRPDGSSTSNWYRFPIEVAADAGDGCLVCNPDETVHHVTGGRLAERDSPVASALRGGSPDTTPLTFDTKSTHTHQPGMFDSDVPEWLRILADIPVDARRREVGVDASTTTLVKWAREAGHDEGLLVAAAEYVASAWDGTLRGRTDLSRTFQWAVRKQIEFASRGNANGRAGTTGRNTRGATEPVAAGSGGWEGFETGA